jgi:hypothetical protein
MFSCEPRKSQLELFIKGTEKFSAAAGLSAAMYADFRSLITLVNSTYIFQILAGFSLALALVSSCRYQCQIK